MRKLRNLRLTTELKAQTMRVRAFYNNSHCAACRCGWKRLFPKVHHAAETNMVGAGIDFPLTARADHVSGAVLVGTEE